MALSCCYSNWLELDQFNSDLSFLPQTQTTEFIQPDHLLEYDSSYVFSNYIPVINNNNNMDSTQKFLYSDNYNSKYSYSLLPYFDTTPTPNYPDIYPSPEYKLICPHQSKRQKPYDVDCDFVMSGNGFVPNPSFVSQEFLPHPFPDFSYVEETSAAPVKKKQQQTNGGGGGSLSAQSIAARVRRRKITEKTQELGKHIPGGQKMNTAEMLHAAFKYIKFLQAQVGILQNLPPVVQENEETLGNEELHALLNSSLIQEKLYSADKCLVPTKMVDEMLLEDNMIFQTNTRVKEQELLL